MVFSTCDYFKTAFDDFGTEICNIVRNTRHFVNKIGQNVHFISKNVWNFALARALPY